ncbi:tapetum determinant 1 [Melia azedarach]|uniref:Tapetum determinant 1 n=1 Tax=Melia azedarach TaxID=155640 RepID=A0ACC1YGV5_MELAZ|nr:tapetum determinant 1 [Melia azedarach]
MQSFVIAFKLLLWSSFTFASLLHHGEGEKCSGNDPTLQQTQVGFGVPPVYVAEVKNNCPMCPVINVHLKCGNFSQALVNPRLLKVISYNDCVVNGGLPLAPLQKFSFNYSHSKYVMQPTTWFFQCE